MSCKHEFESDGGGCTDCGKTVFEILKDNHPVTPVPPYCKVELFSSRTCEYGTHGCNVIHNFESNSLKETLDVLYKISELVETNQDCSPNNHTIAVLAMDILDKHGIKTKHYNIDQENRKLKQYIQDSYKYVHHAHYCSYDVNGECSCNLKRINSMYRELINNE